MKDKRSMPKHAGYTNCFFIASIGSRRRYLKTLFGKLDASAQSSGGEVDNLTSGFLIHLAFLRLSLYNSYEGTDYVTYQR